MQPPQAEAGGGGAAARAEVGLAGGMHPSCQPEEKQWSGADHTHEMAVDSREDDEEHADSQVKDGEGSEDEGALEMEDESVHESKRDQLDVDDEGVQGLDVDADVEAEEAAGAPFDTDADEEEEIAEAQLAQGEGLEQIEGNPLEGAPPRPTRALTAWAFFLNEKFAGKPSKEAGEAWRRLPDQEKSQFEERAATDKRRFQEEMGKFKAFLAMHPELDEVKPAGDAEKLEPGAAYLPQARVRKLIKLNTDVKSISKEGLFIITKSAEHFVEMLSAQYAKPSRAFELFHVEASQQAHSFTLALLTRVFMPCCMRCSGRQCLHARISVKLQRSKTLVILLSCTPLPCVAQDLLEFCHDDFPSEVLMAAPKPRKLTMPSKTPKAKSSSDENDGDRNAADDDEASDRDHEDITGDRDEDMDLEDVEDGSGGRRTAGASIMDDCDDGETEGDRGPRTGMARRRRTIASDSDDEEDEEGEEKE
ncbi:MAG: hypothetical protein SGPRY_012314 [Prymnesium sp.]